MVRGGASLRGNVVVMGLLGHYKSRWIFIDPGSNSDIMFEQCFNQLDDDKARLQPVNGTIAGFINETIQPIGYVSFPVTLTDGTHTRTEVLDFLVIPSTSHHDVLLGQDAIVSFNMSVSTPHGALGFPTETGVTIVYKNR